MAGSRRRQADQRSWNPAGRMARVWRLNRRRAPATNTVLETVALGTGTGVIDGVPIAIVFVNA
jgi:hypothetical protein